MSDETAAVVQAGPVALAWDEGARLATLRFVEHGVGSGPEAERLTGRLRQWVDEQPGGPFRLLVDCSEMVDVDAAWRSIWGDVFKQVRDRAVVGWFNANPRVRLAIIMFKKGTGVAGEAFATEAEARTYLEQVAQVP
jgi:hypothetical protein